MAAFRTLRTLGIVVWIAAAVACRGSSTGTPITPTIGTVATIQGRVLRSDNVVPIAGARITIEGVSLTTGVDGTYAISGLRPGNTVLTAQLQGFQSVSELVSLEGAKTVNIFLLPSDIPKYAGSWKGTWTTGERTGGLLMAVVVDTIADTMRVAFDVNGNIVGDFDPPGETYIGTIVGPNVHFSQTSQAFGNVSADLSGGQLVGRATQVPIGGVSRFNFSGTITASTVKVDYVITFNDNTTQNGSATLTR